MAHANFEFGQNHNGRCIHCDSRVVLVSFYNDVQVDQEPFESGEYADDSPEAKSGAEIPGHVEIHDEISGHYCLSCSSLTSLCLNTSRRPPSAEFNAELETLLFKIRMEERGHRVDVTIDDSCGKRVQVAGE